MRFIRGSPLNSSAVDMRPISPCSSHSCLRWGQIFKVDAVIAVRIWSKLKL